MLYRFFQTIKDSLYNPAFYKEQLTSSLRPAFAYYFLFILLLTVLQVLFTLPLFFNAQKDIKQTVSQLASSYPQELDVRITNGVVTTTAQEPYRIPVPPSESEANQPKNLLVIDTKTSYSSTQFLKYDTTAWLTKDTVYYQDGQGQIKSADLHQISDLHINKEIVMDTWKKVQPYTVWIGPGIAILFFIVLLLGSVLRLGYLALLALLVMVFGKIVRKQLTFKQSYTVLLYAVTLPLIISTGLSILSFHNVFHGIALSFTVLTLLSVIVNLFASQKSKAE